MASLRRTDEEIRERIAMWQQAIEEEMENGGSGGEDWWREAKTAIRELSWVLGEAG
jgi:hypothetical protein